MKLQKFMNDSIIDGFVFDVSDYPEINDLIIASDILISDYSSLFSIFRFWTGQCFAILMITMNILRNAVCILTFGRNCLVGQYPKMNC